MRIGVIGAGAWGTALALVAARHGGAVTLWTREAGQARTIEASRENARYLPGNPLPPNIKATHEAGALTAADMVLFAVPAQAMRATALSLASALAEAIPVVACAKGIEAATGKWMTEVLAECLPERRPAILSGPSFAADVGAGLPTAVTIAARGNLAAELALVLGTPAFRLYHTDDVRGVEIGGAIKNVLAIASGIVAGRRLGASAQAALVARSFAELGRFGLALGARRETLTGLSGLGDLVLTCNSAQSRNFSLGYALGRGTPVSEALAAPKLAEGVHTAAILVELARAHGIAMPIAESVNAILCGVSDVDREVVALMARPQKAEA